jgi:hypothetical protein
MSTNKLPDHKRGQAYVPTFANLTNLAADPTVINVFWTVAGNVVLIFARFGVDPNIGSALTFEFTLPEEVRRDFVVDEIFGVGTNDLGTVPVSVGVNGITNRPKIFYTPATGAPDTINVILGFLA